MTIASRAPKRVDLLYNLRIKVTISGQTKGGTPLFRLEGFRSLIEYPVRIDGFRRLE